MSKRNKRFFRKIKIALLQISAYLFMIFLVILAVCLIVSIPEIIGGLIFG